MQRVLLLHGVMLLIGGLPMLYLGDEIGQLNDYSYKLDPAKQDDSRWVNRPAHSLPDQTAALTEASSHQAQIFNGIKRLIALRLGLPQVAGHQVDVLRLAHPALFGFVRAADSSQPLFVLANFSVAPLRFTEWHNLGQHPQLIDLLTQQTYHAGQAIRLAPYQLLCLQPI